MMRLPRSWQPVLSDQLRQEYFRALTKFLDHERAEYDIYPPAADVFRAFRLTPFDRVKVVILGQDPYHDAGQAHGLAFSVRPGVPPPPSLRNIFKELHVDVDCPKPTDGCLEPWAKQGVLLLNAVLTVRAARPPFTPRQGLGAVYRRRDRGRRR